MTNSKSLFDGWNWQPPKNWIKLTTIDTHTGGMPLRIITSGLPSIEGKTLLEKRRHFMQNHDYIRSGLLCEPRGHADMYGAILLPPASDADFDVFFLNTVGYSPMCGHAVLAIVKVALETGLVSKAGTTPEITIDVPPGRLYARGVVENGRVVQSYFKNVPSFVALRDQKVEVPGIGVVSFDVAFGGAFYAIVSAEECQVEMTSGSYNKLIDYGRRIKRAVSQNFVIDHPFEKDLSSLFGVIFTGPAHDSVNHSRNVTVYEDGEVDRSATGTGVSARAALHFAKGEIVANQLLTVESILGSTMTVRVTEETKFGPYDAVIPEVGGTANIMGQNEFFFEPADAFKTGFMFR